MPSCRISVIRKKGEFIALSAVAASTIKISIRKYGITDPERWRGLVAKRIERR